MYSPSLSKSINYSLRSFNEPNYELNVNSNNNNNNNNKKRKRDGRPRPMPPMPPVQPFGNPFGRGEDDDEDEDGNDSPPFKFPRFFGNDHSSDVYTTKNHIYFKTGVCKESIDKLATEIDNLNNKLSNLSKRASLGTFTPKPIYLHITTNGGDLLAGFFGYDKIKGSKIPIRTVVEGCVASAGSLLSMAGSHRYMTENSHLLIHQLRTGIIGTYEELVDEKANCNQFMSRLINLYKDNSNGKLTKTKIKEILKRDIFWDAKTAIENGLVDELWVGGGD
jgi:ATP-dependent protease ClpP protease subunit